MEQITKANKFILENKENVNPEYRLNYHFMGEYGWINDPMDLLSLMGSIICFISITPMNQYGTGCTGDML